ncbi:MAG: acetyl-CoA carboxylase carboxyl transferase subunit alpha, partial [Streptococcus orisratti]|nr:acetyl-CoA carboxylase carboxyl transferase subunit alpha [Streptococcus orisratti]
AAELMKITANELLQMEVVDKVIPEHGYFSSEIVEMLKKNLIEELAQLCQQPIETLLENRYRRFRKY